MYKIDDPEFIKLIEKGIPIERLENRLRPELGIDDYNKDVEAHDGYHNFSKAGFIGKSENLIEIIHSDWQIVERYGTTHKQIAEVLEKAINELTLPNSAYKIDRMVHSGRQDCPWQCKTEYPCGSGVIIIYATSMTQTDVLSVMRSLLPVATPDPGIEAAFQRLKKREEELLKPAENRDKTHIILNELHSHLIGEHYFFEGKESKYRTNPEVLIKALNLAGG